MTTSAARPPMRTSNEATDEQLAIARQQGHAYTNALREMAAEDGALSRRAGDYVISFVNERAEGMYEYSDGQLVWREASEEANVHLEVAVADGADGRFVPGLAVEINISRDGDRVVSAELPFLWHPFLYHYGGNASVPGPGPYDVTVRVAPARFMRHDPVNGKRYATPVEVRFEQVTFANGRKTSPDAQPRGADAPTLTGSDGRDRAGRRDWADVAATARTSDDPRARTPYDTSGTPSVARP
ncbi:iron transporter [Solwaraspora sp. WMMD406]|nr:iron transporter [Solwaraspora sp. WMMD406]MDG4764382.1 iron transporter [Solwaraspora sp. WMMD406]